MKKTIVTFIITLVILILPLSAYAKADYVVDNGNLLSEAEETALEEQLNNISEKYSFDVVALTVNSLEGKSAQEYADDYYDNNGYRYDGCLLMISTDRDWSISTKGYGITAITDYGIEVIEGEVIKPYFGEDNWAGGFQKYAGIVDEFLAEAKNNCAYDVDNTYTNENGKTYKKGKNWDLSAKSALISIVVAAVIAAVVVLIVKGNYKPVRFKADAADYLVDGSLHLTSEYDRFLYSNVTKTKIESESSKGGSSTHTSSSGSTHGGGSGKF
ncbi:MAG: TPM domain-containing protein [Eubacterium sp.]|nr:TPM domain-containing protein [Eubacterium sp.]